jgi:hypothetical protein
MGLWLFTPMGEGNRHRGMVNASAAKQRPTDTVAPPL